MDILNLALERFSDMLAAGAIVVVDESGQRARALPLKWQCTRDHPSAPQPGTRNPEPGTRNPEPTMPKKTKPKPQPQPLHDLMSRWPESWKRSEEDLSTGRALVAEFLPFVDHLVAKGLSPRTVRRHVDNLWIIGGEIISELDTYPEDRAFTARELLRKAIMGGEAPLIQPLDEALQRACDATARKLGKWMGEARGAHQRADIGGEPRKTTLFRGEGVWDRPPGHLHHSSAETASIAYTALLEWYCSWLWLRR